MRKIRTLINRIMILTILFTIIGNFTASISIDAATLNTGRIYAYMPEIVVEVSGKKNIGQNDVSVKLGNEKLQVVDVQKYDNTLHSQRIIVLLDVSKSNKQLDDMKMALLTLIDSLNDNSKVILYTYGTHITKILSGEESKRSVKNKIRNITICDEDSKMYEALVGIYQKYFSKECTYDRQYILLLSSLGKQSLGTTTSTEAKKKILDKSLPVYALVPNVVSEDGINSLSAFVRTTGGMVKTYSKSKLISEIKKLKKQIDDISIIKLLSASNKANSKKKMLTLTIKESTITENIRLINSKVDNIPPTVTKITADVNKNAIIVSFSEKMLGAQYSYNYSIQNDGKEKKIKFVEYDSIENKAFIYMEDTIYNGIYTIKLTGITDNSQDKNPLVYQKENHINNAVKEKGFLAKYYWIFLIVISVVGILAIVILIIKHNSRKTTILESKKLEELNNKLDRNQKNLVEEVGNLYKNVSPQQKNILVYGSNGKKVTFRINMKNRVEQRIELEIIKSIIVGRSLACELSVDDHNLSRQHFAIEEEKGELVISDLNSRNGTFLNGTKLVGRQVLKNYDKIMAGATEFILYIE